jgi:transcriptional regulator with XRE-family HTH domain
MSDDAKRKAIAERLRDPDYRRAFVERYAVTSLAFQVRALRLARGWSQQDLSARSGVSVSSISRCETGDYAGLSIRMLARLAAGFDVGALVRLAPFSDVLDAFCAPPQAVPSFAEDARAEEA